MNLLVERVDVWAAALPDKPGALAAVLAALRDAGANLQFVISRRSAEKRGSAVVFVTPLESDREIAAAATLGFNVTQRLHSVRIFGEDRPGVAAELTQRLADAGINLRGFSASVIGKRFAAYVGLDSIEDTIKALEVLQAVETDA